MTQEAPFSHNLIEDLVSKGEARPLWPVAEREPDEPEGLYDTSNDWIYQVLADLGLDEAEKRFIEAISAGHTVPDASRSVRRSPRWGNAFLARLSTLCKWPQDPT